MIQRLLGLMLMCLMALNASAARENLALSSTKVTASYTSSWNNLNSINNGTKGFGMDLANNETWGCWQPTNEAQQYLTYEWNRLCKIDEVSVYLWSDCQSGSGVAVPESWEILYLDTEGEWKPVTLNEGQDYTVERFDVNTVTFEAVETKGLRLMLHAQTNDGGYSAMGVNEWEVYGEYLEEEVFDENAKVNIAPMAESIEATYTSSWNNLNSINNGTKGFGMDLANNETWGCWQSPNAESQTITYVWTEEQTIDSVSVYFWSDSESGVGVVVPGSWYIEYEDADGTLQQVTLLDGESYTTNRLEANHVKFAPVETTRLNLVMNAYLNTDGQYAAIGVNEWEVYSASMNQAQRLFRDYENLVDEIFSYQEELEYRGAYYMIEFLDDAIIENELDPDEADAQVIRASIAVLQEKLNEAKASYAVCDLIDAEIEKILKLFDEALYPGLEELFEAYEEADAFVQNGYGVPADNQATYDKLQQAILDYYFSQLYSEDEPADYSFMGKSFQFTKEEAAPTIDLEAGTVVYPNIDSYTESSVPGDAQATGWYIGETDGKQEVGFYQQRMCWYAEKSSGSTQLTVNQNLKDLPNGYYAVSAEVITKDGYLSDQHVFAKTSTTTAVSPSLSAAGWNDTGYGTWERLTTEKILVFDGTLTIGVAGTGDNTTSMGMFATTNFILYYYGEADENNMETLFAKKVEECQKECDGMVYTADKKQYQAVIDANKNAESYEDMKAALKALNAAQLVAQKSINTWSKFLVGPYKTLTERIETGDFSDNMFAIAKATLKLIDAANADEAATYKDAVAINSVTNALLDNYEAVLATAESAKTTDATVQDAIATTIKDQINYFETVSSLPSTDDISVLIANLEKAIRVVEVANLISNGGNDYTTLIINPTVSSSTPTGWDVDIENGDGNGAKSGQHFDGQKGYYFDTYNEKAGEILCTISQSIDNVPNGLYELRAMTRVSATPGAEGCYLFATADNSTEAFSPIRMGLHNYTQYDGTILNSEGGDSIAYVSNTYGTIWEDAAEYFNSGTCADESMEELYPGIYDANTGRGWGWNYTSLQIEVKNHQLTIGVTSDSEITAGKTDTEGNACVPFSGYWFSADNFTLTLIEKGDNEGWSPATGIDSIATGDTSVVAIYNLSGVKVNTYQKGINIVRLSDGTTKKILVK